MSAELKDQIIVFFRGMFAAGVGLVVGYIATVNLFDVTPGSLTQGILTAFVTGALLYLGAWARNATTVPVPVPLPATDQARSLAGAPTRYVPPPERPGGTVSEESKPDEVELAGPKQDRTKSWADWLPF